MDLYGITPDVVRHIAVLAALDLDGEEEERFQRELNRVLSYMRQLEPLNTEGIDPAFQILPSVNIMREDVCVESLPPYRVLQNAPDKEQAYFKIPPILEAET